MFLRGIPARYLAIVMIKRKIIALVAALSAAVFHAGAQNRETIRITNGPWLVDMGSDAVTVMWKTDRPALSWVEACEDTGEHFYASGHRRHYDAEHGRRRCLDTLHTVRLTGLKPGAVYQYRIFSQLTEGWEYSDYVKLGDIASSRVYKKEPYRFRTFSPDDGEVSFAVFNDLHGDSGYFRKMCGNIDFSALDFVLLNGDMCTVTEKESDIFNGWLDTAVEMFATDVPIVFARGNHENRGRFADNYFRYFPNSAGEFYHGFSVGSVDFLVLDCGEDKPDSDIEYGGIAEFDDYRENEALWLENSLATLPPTASDDISAGRTRMVFLHIPPTTSTWHGDRHLQELFLPVLNNAAVQLMLSGHTHSYALLEPDGLHGFPILVNSNRDFLIVKVSGGQTDVSVIDGNGKLRKHHVFRNRY